MFDRGVMQKMLVVAALVLGLYDAYELYEGVTDFNRHVPFLLPGVFLAFAIMISIARRFTLTPEEHAELQRQNALQKATQSLDPFKDDPSSF